MVSVSARREQIGMRADSTTPWQRSRWIRGRARLAKGNYLALAQDQAEEYDVWAAESWARLPFRLAGLIQTDSRGGKSFRLQDAVDFVRTYGLLRHGPAQLRNGDGRESLDDWSKEAEKLRHVLDLYTIREEALQTKSISRVNAVRECIRVLQEVDGSRVDIPENDQECLVYAGDRLSEIIDREREGCRQRLIPAYRLPWVGSRPVGLDDFVFIKEFPNLLAAAYDELALHVAAKAEVLDCEECGRPFHREHGNQTTYCSRACGNRLRQRRYRENRKAKQSDGQKALEAISQTL
jgi:hypothetical protein